MKSIKGLALGLSALMLVGLTGSAFADRNDRWGYRGRPCGGYHNNYGNLSRREAERFRWNQRRINDYRHEARSDGWMSPRERNRLHEMNRHQRLAFRRDWRD